MSKVRKNLSLGGLDDGGALPPPSPEAASDLIRRAASAGKASEEDDEALLAKLTSSPAYTGKPSLTAVAASRPEEPQEPLKIMIPAYLNRALTIAAGERKVSKRWLVMDALRQAGFDVRHDDLFEDGRRFRGSARR